MPPYKAFDRPLDELDQSAVSSATTPPSKNRVVDVDMDDAIPRQERTCIFSGAPSSLFMVGALHLELTPYKN